MKEDRWLKAALIDSTMVADLLLRLNQPPPPSFHRLVPPVSWGQKQQRSTPGRKHFSTTRCSPRTPLSFSGATASPSDETSVSYTQPPSSSRSKNFSQLKEEETELLKERVNLKRDLKSIHVTLKKQRNRRGNLKKIKCGLNQQSTERGALSTEPEVQLANHRSRMESSTGNLHQPILPRHAIKKESALVNSCGMQEVAETNKRGFFLPDLNMPVGDDDIAAELW
ncbi:hypothetical protein Leryth_012078 [Lithospermum erythrorhizon]|nr:hypothetical protein Leryth_012078 [Lithospermum erythrorhizon]